MSDFVYRSLTPNKKSIRLIHILPVVHHLVVDNSWIQPHGEQDAFQSSNPVSCSVLHVSLDNAPAYTALSYHWGDPTQTLEILMDGVTFMVTSNLEAALRHLRRYDEPLTLWVDALCINQNDDVEKSEQLQQMQQIYTQAVSVVAWLGPPADNSDIAVEWIKQYGGRSSELRIGKEQELRLRYLLDTLETKAKDLNGERLKEFVIDLKKHLSPENPEYADLVSALFKIFKRAYWSRIWVVQELTSASSVLFMCGSKSVTEDSLNHASRLLRNFGFYQLFSLNYNRLVITRAEEVSVISIATRSPIRLLKFRKEVRSFPLIHLMRTFRSYQATDPRDKLFALLGIAKDAEALGLHPNYRKSCQDVYTEVTRTLIQKGYFELLSFCRSRGQVANLPSWVHDWSLVSYRLPLQERSRDRSFESIKSILEPGFSASGVNQMTGLEGGNTIGNKMPLLLRATLLGQVQQLGTHWEGDAVGRWLLDLHSLSQLVPHTSESRAHTVWRTAVADQEIRQGETKPRLSEEKVRILHESFKTVDIKLMNAQTIIDAGLSDYCEQLRSIAHGRRPIYASGGYLGIGPRETEQGDFIFIILGADTPYILHQNGQNDTFQLIGEAYVHGVMDGEAMEGDPKVEKITLV